MRRLLFVSALTLLGTAHAEPPPIFKTLDAVGSLSCNSFDPGAVIAAVNQLQPLGREKGTQTLQAYLKSKGNQPVPNGLFAVIRSVYGAPASTVPAPADACTLKQRDLLAGGCIRPPRLGSPTPAPPEDLSIYWAAPTEDPVPEADSDLSFRYPLLIMGGVPLSVVCGYDLGGLAEPVSMHLNALASAPTVWLAKPLAPRALDEVLDRFEHFGRWSAKGEIGRAVKRQLARLKPR